MIINYAMAKNTSLFKPTPKENHHKAYLGIGDHRHKCKCFYPEIGCSIFLENARDMAAMLAEVMVICGMDPCQAKTTIDVTVHAFLHYDRVGFSHDKMPKKFLRKEDLFYNLAKDCLMNNVEAHLAHMIIHRGFKAFYYQKTEADIDESGATPSVPEECAYVHAAKRTVDDLSRFDNLSCEEQCTYTVKIKAAYSKFFKRLQNRKSALVEELKSKCCRCGKKKHPPKILPPPCKTDKPTSKYICPKCCRVLKCRSIGERKLKKKPPLCQDPLNPCVCGEESFGPTWVKSIWEQPDMSLYYKTTIEVEAKKRDDRDPCDDWFNPAWVNSEDDGKPSETDCANWFDPFWLMHFRFRKKKVANMFQDVP